MTSDRDARRTKEDEHLPAWTGIVRKIAEKVTREKDTDGPLGAQGGEVGNNG